MMAECERLKARLLGIVDTWLEMMDAAHVDGDTEFESFEATLDDLISAVTDAAKHGAE